MSEEGNPGGCAKFFFYTFIACVIWFGLASIGDAFAPKYYTDYSATYNGANINLSVTPAKRGQSGRKWEDAKPSPYSWGLIYSVKTEGDTTFYNSGSKVTREEFVRLTDEIRIKQEAEAKAKAEREAKYNQMKKELEGKVTLIRKTEHRTYLHIYNITVKCKEFKRYSKEDVDYYMRRRYSVYNSKSGAGMPCHTHTYYYTGDWKGSCVSTHCQ